MKQFKKILLGLLFLVVFFGLVKFFTPNLKDTPCKLYREFMKRELRGIVVNSYIDKSNHSYPIVEIKNEKTGKIEKLNFVLEKSDVFNKIHVSDFLVKVINSDAIFIEKASKLELVGNVDFGCDK